LRYIYYYLARILSDNGAQGLSPGGGIPTPNWDALADLDAAGGVTRADVVPYIIEQLTAEASNTDVEGILVLLCNGRPYYLNRSAHKSVKSVNPIPISPIFKTKAKGGHICNSCKIFMAKDYTTWNQSQRLIEKPYLIIQRVSLN